MTWLRSRASQLRLGGRQCAVAAALSLLMKRREKEERGIFRTIIDRRDGGGLSLDRVQVLAPPRVRTYFQKQGLFSDKDGLI